MSMKQAYVHNVQTRLNQWDAEIERMMAQTDNTGTNARIRYQNQVNELKKRQKDAQSKLDGMRKSSEGAWEDMQNGVEDAWSRLEKAVKDATAQIAA